MRISGNELSVTVTKACIGVGVVRGVAEDMGHACLALALAEKPPISDILAALENFSDEAPTPDWRKVGGDWLATNLSCLPHGPSFLDFAHLARALNPSAKAIVAHVDFPNLIWGLAACEGVVFEMQTEIQKVMLWLGEKPAELANYVAADIDVDTFEWRRLQKLAAQIMVPADETNSTDAGSALSDND